MKKPTSEQIEKFKAELAALLEKYNAEIYAYNQGNSSYVNEIIVEIDGKDELTYVDSITPKDLKK